MGHPVLLFDDSLSDVTRLCAELENVPADAFAEADPCGSANRLKDILREHGIDWFSSVSEAARAISGPEAGYQVFVLDVYIENSSDNGLSLIPQIRKLFPKATVWLWTSKRHIQEKVLLQMGADALYPKADIIRFAEALNARITGNDEPELRVLHLNGDDRDLTVRYKDIIAVQREFNSFILYLFQPGRARCSMLKVPRSNNIISFLEKEEPQSDGIFLRINKNTLVSYLMAETFCKDDKGYYLEMRQHAGNFEVGRAYVKKVLEYFTLNK